MLYLLQYLLPATTAGSTLSIFVRAPSSWYLCSFFDASRSTVDSTVFSSTLLANRYLLFQRSPFNSTVSIPICTSTSNPPAVWIPTAWSVGRHYDFHFCWRVILACWDWPAMSPSSQRTLDHSLISNRTISPPAEQILALLFHDS